MLTNQNWCAERDLNPRSTNYEFAALTTKLSAHILLGRGTENQTPVYRLKADYFITKLYPQTYGTPYGIRTHDLRDENPMSSASRRTVHRNRNYTLTKKTCQAFGAPGEIRTHESRVLQAPPLDRSGTDAYYLLNIFTNPLPIFFCCHSFSPLNFGGEYRIRTYAPDFSRGRFSKPLPSTTRPIHLVIWWKR